MTRALIHGAGRMARQVLAQIPLFENYELVGLVSRTRPDDLGVAECFTSLEDPEAPIDLLIDFTLPGGTRHAAQWCARNGVALLSGTTGLGRNDIEALEKAALKVPVLWAPNLSFGVALVSSLASQAAGALGLSAKVTINDIHHRHKVDAPSGTALALAEAVVQGRSQRIQGGDMADGDEPVFSSERVGEVIGEHTVSFRVADEEIEITHRALKREVFAKGALKAGEWLVAQGPGFYSTRDWLDLP